MPPPDGIKACLQRPPPKCATCICSETSGCQTSSPHWPTEGVLCAFVNSMSNLHYLRRRHPVPLPQPPLPQWWRQRQQLWKRSQRRRKASQLQRKRLQQWRLPRAFWKEGTLWCIAMTRARTEACTWSGSRFDCLMISTIENSSFVFLIFISSIILNSDFLRSVRLDHLMTRPMNTSWKWEISPPMEGVKTRRMLKQRLQRTWSWSWRIFPRLILFGFLLL